MQHSSSDEWTNIGSLSGYSGENLYMSSSKNTDGAGKSATQLWYDEIANYDFSTGASSNGEVIGHFTQLVWKKSTKVGFGLGVSDSGTYVCANYYLGGNYGGEYLDNVMPLSSSTNLKISSYIIILLILVF